VESAWQGVDSTWQYQLTNIEKKPRSKIRELINYCKEKKLKTVFWNKEDPANYRIFIETARLFDYIFTTDKAIIHKYKKNLGYDKSVFALPFAAQPVIHNPVNSSYKDKENVAFAGTWYRKRHAGRQKELEMILKAAKPFGLSIFDRMYEYTKSNYYHFPAQFQENIIGCLDYSTMSAAYRMFKVFLNVNTVNDSPSMFSRRVFEILASGTNVLSTDSFGIRRMFKKIVPICRSADDVKEKLRHLLDDREYSQRLSLLGIRKINKLHLYRHRFEYLITILGLTKNEGKNNIEKNGVSVITPTNRPQFADNIFANYQKQKYTAKELIIILNKDSLNLKEWEEKAKAYQNVTVYQLPEEKTLGECLNFGVGKSKYSYVSKFDDDNYYAPYFLTDLMHAFNYTDADIVGKGTYFSYLEGKRLLALRFPGYENRFVKFLSGSALIIKKEVLDRVKFINKSQGEDTAFIKECVNNGFKLYSTDKYNYACVRRPNPNEHTWKITEKEYLRKCQVVSCEGDFKKYITV
jgi:spore maturation protein CgeB